MALTLMFLRGMRLPVKQRSLRSQKMLWKHARRKAETHPQEKEDLTPIIPHLIREILQMLVVVHLGSWGPSSTLF